MITMIMEKKQPKAPKNFPINPCHDRYVIAIDGRLASPPLVSPPYNSANNGYETRYVGIHDEGYYAWPYPMSQIHEAMTFLTPEAAIKEWYRMKDAFRKENPGWDFDYGTLGLIKIQMSDTIPFE